MYKNPDVVEFIKFAKEVEAKLLSEEYDPKKIDSAKRNLRRTMENRSEHFHFVNTSRILLIYSDSLKTHELVESLPKVKQELSNLKASSKDEKTVFYAAKIIRNEIKGMTDKMNWPPSYTDLTTEKVDIGIHLSTVLNVILSCKLAEIDSIRFYRISMSLGQDLAYNVSNGRIRTPKSVLFPYKYKMLTSNTELINMVNLLG